MATTLAQVRRIALALPESVEAPHHLMTSFRVRGKIFATVPPQGGHLHLFVDEARREAAVAAEPEAFEPLWWGGKVAGLRVVLAAARPAAVRALLQAAWRAKAPPALLAAAQPQGRSAPVTMRPSRVDSAAPCRPGRRPI